MVLFTVVRSCLEFSLPRTPQCFRCIILSGFFFFFFSFCQIDFPGQFACLIRKLFN